MIFTLLNRLEKSGDLYILSRAGLLSTKVYFYREIYMDYDKNLKMGMSAMEAIHKTSVELKVSQAKIYRAKHLMEK